MAFFDRLTQGVAAIASQSRAAFNRHQIVRYLIVGTGNTAVSYSAYALLLLIGFEYRLASLVALIIGIVFSYITQSRVVFRNAGRATLLKFLIAWVLIYFINISIIYLLIQASINAYLAGAIATLPVTLISYLILKLAVFVRQKTS